MSRQILALMGGVTAGYLCGWLLGLASYPFLPISASELWLGKIVALSIAAFITGAVTSLISWKHTPGLPGMAFSLTLVLLGLTAHETVATRNELTDYYWITAIADSIFVLLGFLLTYMAAWAADTQIIFRTLPVKPPGKQVNSKLLLTQLLPCALVTAAGGAIIKLALPLPALISTPLAFILIAFIASLLFKSRSTLWYSAAVPCYFAALGLLAISYPQIMRIAETAGSARQRAAFTICGLGSAGAILGHWIWVRRNRKKPSGN